MAVSALAFLIALGFTAATTRAVAGPSTCFTKHCPAHTHCCPGCNGNAICVRDGAHCPECAPQ